jgi:hypothetical protein
MKTIHHILFVIMSILLVGCGITIVTSGGVKTDLWGNERKDWSKINTEEAVATVINRRDQEEVMVEVSFKTQKGEMIKREFDLSRSFERIVVGDRFKVLYDIDSPRSFLFFVSKPVFDVENSRCMILNINQGYCSRYVMEDSIISACEVLYNFFVTDKRYRSQTSMLKEDFLKLNYKNIKEEYYRLHYNKDNPQINWLDYNVPYEIKENCAFVTSDIGSRTNRQLNKAARRLKEGGTLFWTTSNIDFSDNAVINQKELTKMHQFLETYEPKGLFGKKLAIKVEIVDHRNIGEVLVEVDRDKLE